MVDKNRNVPQLSSPSLWLCLYAVTVLMRASSLSPVTPFKQWCKHHLELTLGDKPNIYRHSDIGVQHVGYYFCFFGHKATVPQSCIYDKIYE